MYKIIRTEFMGEMPWEETIAVAKTRQELEFHLKSQNIMYYGRDVFNKEIMYTHKKEEPTYGSSLYFIQKSDIIILSA